MHLTKEAQKRLWWRWQFLKRNEYVKKLLAEKWTLDNEEKRDPLGFSYPRNLMEEIKFVHEELASISVLHKTKGNKLLNMDLYFEYSIAHSVPEDKMLLPEPGLIRALNRNKPSITIEIKLDRKKEDIHKDIDLLLAMLEVEAKRQKIKLWHRKRPRFDIFKKMLQVYDMRKESPKMTYSDIAKHIFPDEVYQPTAHKRKARQERIATPNAINKVMHYAKEATKMIDKGGWRQI